MTDGIRNPAKIPTDLNPAEQKFARCLAEGRPCRIGNGELPEKVEVTNLVRGEIIRFFAYGGNEENPVLGPLICLQGAWISGELDLTHANIPYALLFGNCQFDASMIMQHAKCVALDLSGSRLAQGLNADWLTTKGNVYLWNGFSAEGEVRLLGANIGGDLNCEGGKFDNPGKCALSADKLTAKSDVILSGGFSAKGEVRLVGADIGGNLDCEGGGFDNPDGGALDIEGGNISGNLFWRETTCKGNVLLTYAKANVLEDDSDSWESCRVDLEGFTYNRFVVTADVQFRINWLSKRPDGVRFSPSSYQQAAKVLFGMGHVRDAREILLEKERCHTEDKRTVQSRKFLRQLWDVFAGYGYRLRWTAYWMASFVLFGAFLFNIAARHNQIAPHQPAIMASAKYQTMLHGNTPMKAARAAFPAEYPEFTPLAFSLDVFIPFFALHQEPFWVPASGGKDDLWKASILLVFMLVMLATLAWSIWAFQDWVRRAQKGVLGLGGPAGVATGVAVVCLALGFDLPTGLLVFILAVLTTLAWSIWIFQGWVWRAQNNVFGLVGLAGVATGMAIVCLALGFDFPARFVNALFDFKAWLLEGWHWLTAWYWVEIVAGWMLTSLFLLSVTGLLRPRQSSGERD